MLYFITSNDGKYREAKRIGEMYGVKIERVDIHYPEHQETSLRRVARLSITALKDLAPKPFFLEDSGLFIPSLNGFPGVYSSYVYKTIGNEGILKLMRDVTDRRAYFKSIVAFFDGRVHLFEGKVSGRISFQIKGNKGFGFDPIFEYRGRTFAEMGDEKNQISHRRKAMEKFLKWYINLR
jgi:XTP/dITP diphosphohydrolase